MKVFSKILIANRGEIALRIIRSLREMNISSVVIYSENDRDADFVKDADEAYLLEGSKLSETYLNIKKIIQIAEDSKCEAIHPGYGFLSENPDFAEAITKAGLNFIGPTAEMIRLMGDKEKAREIARYAGVPILSGIEGKYESLLSGSSSLGFPLLVKASAGGGGKAMRIVRKEQELAETLETTSREAFNYFGNSNLIVEKYLENARHIEVQVLGDHYGKILILGDRDCSVQRRHQKVIEEAPAYGISDEVRNELHSVSMQLCENIGYVNAGTIEYLMDEDGHIYFLEMNTRIQVEHPVTEMVTGIDLVKEQVYIAAGNRLSMNQEDLSVRGHAIEARLYAEDPEKEFLPSPGYVWYYQEPENPGLRIDSSISKPGIISSDFDPMIAKLIIHADSREDARIELIKAISNFKIAGLKTNREFLTAILKNQNYKENKHNTLWLEKQRDVLLDEVSASKSMIPGYLVMIAWMIKKMQAVNPDSQSPWQNLGRWRHYSSRQILFQAVEHKIVVKKVVKNELVILIDDREYRILNPLVETDKVRFILNNTMYNAVVITGKDLEEWVIMNGFEFNIRAFDFIPDVPFITESDEQNSFGPLIIKSPLHGKIIKLKAGVDSLVSKGDLLITLDAMKIENKILAPSAGTIINVFINVGDQVSLNQALIEIEQFETEDNNQ